MPQDNNRKHEWTKKPKSEWTEQDWDDYHHYQRNRKPIRFQFGPDATEEDIDKFLDQIFGPETNISKDGERTEENLDG